jgi:aspartate ammonia-lyase
LLFNRLEHPTMMMMPPTTETAMRQEKDSIGVREVPANAYYGIQALRGSENFPITGIKPAQQYHLGVFPN